ncbi:MAG: M61 family metallopeptidase [Rhodocyclaceae bacterium]|nr:M61 family metallopeptidase [Rhodocyclaceae bacterium]
MVWLPRVIRYRIVPIHPAAHLWQVTVTVDQPDTAGQRFALPVWIPGSYMIREFARHIGRVEARCGGYAVACEKINKCTWQCAPVNGALALTYTVYAWDLSVRGAHLDHTHGFFNGASVFLLVEGQRDSACGVEIVRPIGECYQGWKVATSLAGPTAGDNGRDFGMYHAENYDALIDHPVEMGLFTHATFDACGVIHHLVLTGRHRADVSRLTADLKKICETQIRLFEPETATAPMSEYWFLITVVGEGFGGLEHRASTALIVGRDELPLANEPRVTTGYRKLLSLASHEYFHTWNVKRIMPERFVPYDLTQENYTKQLWFFEGFTDYYDDLMLVRSGVISVLEYLELEADGIGRVLSQAGRTKQSVADSSFDSWIKYYRQDENSPNSIVSYYQKGALIGLALDLTIREATQDRYSLDDVMRDLWTRFGKPGIGVPEGEIERVSTEVAGIDLSGFFALTVYGTADPDLTRLLATAGVTLSWRANGTTGAKTPERVLPTLGAKLASESNGDAKLAQVFDGGSAIAAGLSAGDTIVAVDRLRVNAGNLERRIRTYDIGSTLDVIAFRRDEMMEIKLTLIEPTTSTCVLTLSESPPEAKTRRTNWLRR